jgi:hypothetical protein
MRLAPSSVVLFGVVAACAGADDQPTARDASVVEAGTDDGRSPGQDGAGDDRSAADSPQDADSSLHDAEVGNSPKDSIADVDVKAPDPGELDAAWHDGGFGSCTTLPPLPAANRDGARFWFATSKILAPYRARMRDSVIYGAARPPYRLDGRASSLCLFPGPTDPSAPNEDILAPPDSSLVVVAFGGGGPREIRVSTDDGKTWTTARGPGVSDASGKGSPSALTAPPSTGTLPSRLYATYGGSTLDVSENGGLDWTRVIEGASTPAEGFVVDSAGETLWYLSEVIIDEVAALWIPISANGPLPSTWNVLPVPSFKANGVYIAQADPFDPHAIYVGGEGQLGYLTSNAGQATVDVTWSRSPTDPTLPFTYVVGLWVDPSQAKHLVWGGGQQGGGPAQLLESVDQGRDAREIPIEGHPEGYVTSIQYLPAISKLAVLVRRRSDASLAVYLVDR